MTTEGVPDRIPLDTVLHSPRCRYRIVEEDDAVHSWSASRHPGFCDGMAWDPPASVEELRGGGEEAARRWREDRAYAWSIEAADTGAFVGRIAIGRTDEPEVWTLGFWVHPDQQRRGYATEAVTCLIGFAFERLEAKRVTAAAATWNETSLRVLERAGMQRVGTEPHGFRKQGRWVEEAVHAIDRDAWLGCKGA